jgi:hypothetical protein
VEPIAPSLICCNAPMQTGPSAADLAALGAPFASGHKQKRPPTIPKHKQTKTLAYHVMTQIELPPYHGPRVIWI